MTANDKGYISLLPKVPQLSATHVVFRTAVIHYITFWDCCVHSNPASFEK
jgi:hypothetical protein